MFADAASCLEERLAELHLSTSPQRDSEMENEEDATSLSDARSSEAEGISVSAFESYIRGMVGNVVFPLFVLSHKEQRRAAKSSHFVPKNHFTVAQTRAQSDGDIRPKPKSCKSTTTEYAD